MKCINPQYINSIKQYVPCGCCVACQRNKVNDWTIRISNEFLYWDDAVMLTMTYNDDSLPRANTLSRLKELIRNDYVSFKNKLRSYCQYHKIKFKIVCALEFGTHNTHRPHFHCILFGFNAKDKDIVFSFWNKCEKFCFQCDNINMLTQQSREKTARYITKYILKQHDKNITEVFRKKKKYINYKNLFFVSQGIGKQYFIDNISNILANGIRLKNGKIETALPRYYIKLFRKNLNYNDLYVMNLLDIEKDISLNIYYNEKEFKGKSYEKLCNRYFGCLVSNPTKVFFDNTKTDAELKRDLYSMAYADYWSDIKLTFKLFGQAYQGSYCLENFVEELEKQYDLYLKGFDVEEYIVAQYKEYEKILKRYKRVEDIIYGGCFKAYDYHGKKFRVFFHPCSYQLIRLNLVISLFCAGVFDFIPFSQLRLKYEEMRNGCRVFLQSRTGSYDEVDMNLKNNEDFLKLLYNKQFFIEVSYEKI